MSEVLHGCRAHYYAELAVSSPALALTIAMEEWPGWVGLSSGKYQGGTPSKVVINPSTNWAHHSLNFVDLTYAVTTTPNQPPELAVTNIIP